MTFIIFLLVLGITVFIHELGHFIFAKKAGVHIYEFSIGMGPKIHTWKRKNDPTDYSIRLFPIGGFVSIAGEDEYSDTAIPKDKQLVFKPWKDRFLTIIAGVMFNFILALILLFIVGIINGVPKYDTKISTVEANYPISKTNIKSGDTIIKYNGKKVTSSDKLAILLAVNKGENIKLTVKHKDNKIEDISVTPVKVTEDEITSYKVGISLNNERTKDIASLITYPFKKVYSLVDQMITILKYLITGKLSLSNLSGPVGIYQVVDGVRKTGIVNIIYLIAYLCINVGVINILPLPAFDGGRAFFLIIEKITHKKVNQKFENTVHMIGFYLLLVLMVVITYHDILRIIK